LSPVTAYPDPVSDSGLVAAAAPSASRTTRSASFLAIFYELLEAPDARLARVAPRQALERARVDGRVDAAQARLGQGGGHQVALRDGQLVPEVVAR